MCNVLLVIIAGISLFVGGIGIMNIMLATVTERTREIGIRRALGATRKHIIQQFLTETVVLTASGGLLGVLALAGAGGASTAAVEERPERDRALRLRTVALSPCSRSPPASSLRTPTSVSPGKVRRSTVITH